MKRLVLALLALASLGKVKAQTAEEIIQRYSDKLGGLAAFNQIATAKMTGTVIQQSIEMPMVTQVINNRAVRTYIEAMGYAIINVYFKGSGWKQNHFAGAETPTDIAGEELAELKVQASLASPLMDYKSRQHKVALLGKEDVEGVNCYKISLLNKDNNKTTYYYIDVTDYTLIKSVTSRQLQGQDVEVETYYSDYRQFNGLKFAMTRSQKIMGQEFASTRLERIQLNVPVDESIFRK